MLVSTSTSTIIGPLYRYLRTLREQQREREDISSQEHTRLASYGSKGALHSNTLHPSQDQYCLTHLVGPSISHPSISTHHHQHTRSDSLAVNDEEAEPTMTLSGVTPPTHAPFILTITHLTSFSTKPTPPPLLTACAATIFHDIDNDDSAEVERNLRGTGATRRCMGAVGGRRRVRGLWVRRLGGVFEADIR
jgi:hypothetical protein